MQILHVLFFIEHQWNAKQLTMVTSCGFYLSSTIYLVVLLDAVGCHTVDDGIPSWIHACNGVADGQQWEGDDNTEPQDDVEYDWVVIRILLGNVQVFRLQSNYIGISIWVEMGMHFFLNTHDWITFRLLGRIVSGSLGTRCLRWCAQNENIVSIVNSLDSLCEFHNSVIQHFLGLSIALQCRESDSDELWQNASGWQEFDEFLQQCILLQEFLMLWIVALQWGGWFGWLSVYFTENVVILRELKQ